jgi:hypothetical protein
MSHHILTRLIGQPKGLDIVRRILAEQWPDRKNRGGEIAI